MKIPETIMILKCTEHPRKINVFENLIYYMFCHVSEGHSQQRGRIGFKLLEDDINLPI